MALILQFNLNDAGNSYENNAKQTNGINGIH